jgi:multiple sugar transport system substrate-binding protein
MTVQRMLPLLLAGAALFAGCGGGDEAAPASQTPRVEGAKVIDLAAKDEPAKGTVKFCTGKDTSGALGEAVDKFNAEAPDGLSAKLVEFPAEADDQRAQFIQRAQAKSPDCDLFYADDVWIAEFASQKWIYDLTPYVESRRADFVPSVLGGVRYADRFWAVPKQTNAGFLYYRTDEVSKPPATWQELYANARKAGGYAFQGAAYEGLTVNFLEVAFAAGGTVLSKDGSRSTIDSPENLKALQLMVDGMKSGAALKASTTYMEEETRQAFEAGNAAYMRNWPYAYPLAKKSKVRNSFAVSPLPAFEGAGTGQVVGSRNLVVSAFSKNVGGALKLLDSLTSPETERRDAVKYSLAPVLMETYRDKAFRKAVPYAKQLLNAVQEGTARPVSPVYPQISQAIYQNVNKALSGETSPEDALKRADTQIDKALRSF